MDDLNQMNEDELRAELTRLRSQSRDLLEVAERIRRHGYRIEDIHALEAAIETLKRSIPSSR